MFDLKHEFANEWYQAMHTSAGATERKLNLNNLGDMLPIFIKGFKHTVATDILLFSTAILDASVITLSTRSTGPSGGVEVGFLGGTPVRTIRVLNPTIPRSFCLP